MKSHSARLLLLLDFDGTLSPIVKNPRRASLPQATRRVLTDLARRPGVAVAIVSGRRIEDLRALVGLPVIYAGNHGLRIEGPGFRFLAPGAGDNLAELHQLAA